jgi:hypothetical protein
VQSPDRRNSRRKRGPSPVTHTDVTGRRPGHRNKASASCELQMSESLVHIRHFNELNPILRQSHELNGRLSPYQVEKRFIKHGRKKSIRSIWLQPP